ncbi:3-alpha domain-containing protein [Rhizobium leguminosarum]|uniref:3-alpha domain-containing protein n=1 Tax=Rhizobium leguminosarum TaxID=384 RepID=UPI0032B115E3
MSDPRRSGASPASGGYFYIDPFNRDELAGIAALDRLASSWRDYAARRLQSGRIEDWAKRLEGHEAAGD